MNIEIVNIGNLVYPKWRLAIDGTIVARGGSIACLQPLHKELEEDESKAVALRDHCQSMKNAETISIIHNTLHPLREF